MTEDTFKLADEVRAENRGDVWDPAIQTATPSDDAASGEVKVEETTNE